MNTRGIKRYWRKHGSGSSVAVIAAAVLVAAVWGVLLAISPGPAVDIHPTSQPALDEPETEPAPLTEARKVLASGRPVTISVLGDSTGNASTEWVGLWAKRLAADHRVEQHVLNPTLLEWSSNVYTYGTDGPSVTIWNAGVPGADAAYPIQRLAKLQPERPDLVVYSFGHNNDVTDMSPQMSRLTRAVHEKWGGAAEVAILQNPSLGDPFAARQAQTVPELAAWASNAGVPVVDVYVAFVREGRPLPSLLLDDGLHPNHRGSTLWASTVAKALGQ